MFTLQESEFLKNALMVPWTLSTSQQPQQQIQTSPDCNNPELKNKVNCVLCPVSLLLSQTKAVIAVRS